eukprot:sb/3473244/
MGKKLTNRWILKTVRNEHVAMEEKLSEEVTDPVLIGCLREYFPVSTSFFLVYRKGPLCLTSTSYRPEGRTRSSFVVSNDRPGNNSPYEVLAFAKDDLSQIYLIGRKLPSTSYFPHGHKLQGNLTDAPDRLEGLALGQIIPAFVNNDVVYEKISV